MAVKRFKISDIGKVIFLVLTFKHECDPFQVLNSKLLSKKHVNIYSTIQSEDSRNWKTFLDFFDSLSLYDLKCSKNLIVVLWFRKIYISKLHAQPELLCQKKKSQTLLIHVQDVPKCIQYDFYFCLFMIIMKQDWKAFKPSRRRKRNGNQDILLEIWQNLNWYWLSLTIPNKAKRL